MQNEIEQKVREEAQNLLRKSGSLVLKSLESQPLSGAEEPEVSGAAHSRLSPPGAEESRVSVAEESGASGTSGTEALGASGGEAHQVSASFKLDADVAVQTRKTRGGTKRKQPGVPSAGAEEPISSGVEEPGGTKRPRSPDKPGADKGHVAQESASAMVSL